MELLVAIFILPPLWLTIVVIGIWCWWRARDTSTLLLALWGMCTPLLVLVVQSWLLQAELIPLANEAAANGILAFGLFAYPLYLFVKFQLKLTKPQSSKVPLSKVPERRASYTARFLQILVTLLAALGLSLAGDLLVGSDWFGKGAFEGWMYVGFWVSLVTLVVAGPYALLSLLRRSQPIGISLWILAALLITTLCYVAMLFYFAIHITIQGTG